MNTIINTQTGMLIWVNYGPKEKSDTKTLNNIYSVLNRLKQALKSILNTNNGKRIYFNSKDS